MVTIQLPVAEAGVEPQKGALSPAQGSVLGSQFTNDRALKGRSNLDIQQPGLVRPFRAQIGLHPTQGVALGYYRAPRWG
jgi:hypothetical protein